MGRRHRIALFRSQVRPDRLRQSRNSRSRSDMSLIPYVVARRFLFKMDAEHAHDVVLAGIARIQHTPRAPTPTSRRTRRSTTRSTGSALRHQRADVAARRLIVASVSAIYGLGGPESTPPRCLILDRGGGARPAGDPARLVELQYERNDLASPQQVPRAGRHHRGLSRIRGEGGAHLSSSATRSSASPRSTRSPARSSKSCDGSRCSRRRTTSPTKTG